MYDISIIGAGVVGAAIARELSKYKLKICLIEKEEDVACGATKANSGIVHGGYAEKAGSIKAKFSYAGNRMYPKLNEELNFGFAQIGSLVIGFDEHDAVKIRELYANGKKNGVMDLHIVDGDFVRSKEPHLNQDITISLHCPTAGITSPYEFAIALAENAIHNGVELKLATQVIAIDKINVTTRSVIASETKQSSNNNAFGDFLDCHAAKNAARNDESNDYFVIKTNNSEEIPTKIIINAAGLYADEIAKMVGCMDFAIKPRQGQYLLFEKDQGELVNSVIFQTPTTISKGILVTKTYHGNLLIGPDATPITDKDFVETAEPNINYIIAAAKKSLDKFDLSKVITTFAGNRAAPSTDDFIIGHSLVKNFINAAGIESPGLTAAPAIAVHIAQLIKESDELNMVLDANFDPIRLPYNNINNMLENNLNELIKDNPKYGCVVCRCETVSEGEICDALNRNIPISSLDAIKRRTRTCMGRCQGGFCTPKIMDIMHKELQIPKETITKKGKKSCMLMT